MARKRLITLSEDDVEVLRELAAERRRGRTGQLRGSMLPDDPMAPEVYEAMTPAGGIPAMIETSPEVFRPGHAVCTVFRIVGEEDDASLRQLGALTKVVYNLSFDPIGAHRPITIKRDKFGRWVAEPPLPFPSADDSTGTGTGNIPDDEDGPDPVYDDTGTGTGEDTGGPGGIYYPCAAIAVEETDVFCEPAGATLSHVGGVGLGTGTGTDGDNTTQFYLNLYRRTVLLGINRFTGCLERTPLAWNYVRTVACCEPECTAPDTGTGDPEDVANCCPDGTLAATVIYTVDGPIAPLCGTCLVAGDLHQTAPGEMVWTNSAGGSTCGGRVFLELTLYCAGTGWRVKGRLRRYLPFVEDTTETFDLAVVPFGVGDARLAGSWTSGLCPSSPVVFDVANPCVEDDEPGTVSTTCCSDDLLPETITATFTDKTGDLVCLPDSVELTWDGSQWLSAGDALAGCAGCGGPEGGITLSCTGATPTSWSTNILSPNTPTSGSCDPFVLTWTGASGNGLCTGTVTMTITE